MLARTRTRTTRAVVFALAAVGAMVGAAAMAQQGVTGRSRTSPKAAAPAGKDQAPPASFRQSDIPRFELKGIPANPNDAIATINGEAITRRQLSDECVARKGEEILETLIARKLIDQALRQAKLEITAAEI